MAKKKSTSNTMSQKAHVQGLTAIRRKLESIYSVAEAARQFQEARDDGQYDAASSGAFSAIAEMTMKTLHEGGESVHALLNGFQQHREGGAA